MALCIVVPFREQPQFDRAAQLRALLRALSRGVPRGVDYRVLVIEQCEDGQLFNRGKLLNVGFALRPRGCQSCVFHDVDLVPCDTLVRHYLSRPGVYHLGARWNRYNDNPRYLGGVLQVEASVFEAVNGFPNTFWGWGGEDDALYERLQRHRQPISGPLEGSYRDLEGVSLRRKLQMLREHRLKCMSKWEELERDRAGGWHENGLSTLDFHLMRSECVEPRVMRYLVDLRYPCVTPPPNVTCGAISSDHERTRKRKTRERDT